MGRVVPVLAERVVSRGGRLLIVAGEDRLVPLDRLLWTFKAESFLPHACAGGDADADQPILLAAAPDAANGARNILLVDGVGRRRAAGGRSEAHTSELQSLMRISYAVFCLKKKNDCNKITS